MDVNQELSQFHNFLRGCLEELINCHGNSEWIAHEFELARFVYPSLDKETFQEGQAWIEGSAIAKEKKRSKAARKKVAIALAHQISRKIKGGKKLTPQERLDRINVMRSGWIAIDQLVGLNLTQIEACRMILKRPCNCEKNCRKVNFTRDWAEVETCCAKRLSELDI